jgi:hypothetical protein
MRERSHKKGEAYQQDVKAWLIRAGFLGLDAELFGDAYDVTKRACTIGGVVYDFSLKLGRPSLTRNILSVECKYRDERRGNVTTEFRTFLKRVYSGLRAAEPDEFDSAVFLFVSTIPPDGWRDYLRNRSRFCKGDPVWEPGQPVDERVLGKLVHSVHVLVLGVPIIERR